MTDSRPTCEYEPADRRRTRRWAIRLTAAAVVVAIAFVIANLPTTLRTVRIDAVTGSSKISTVRFGLFRQEQLSSSPLQRWLEQNGMPWTPNWQMLSQSRSNLLGRTENIYSTPPPIYRLAGTDDSLQATIIRHASDEQVRSLVTTLQSGTLAQQQAVVKEAQDRTVAAFENWSREHDVLTE